ncbi:hypothetical protein ACFZC5_34100 [Nocardia gamkensis]|uniref:restriction endonuclease subunit S n=1 Tax=Nocardia gamkensis TaxID=352869 RepID=UPI0036EFC58B
MARITPCLENGKSAFVDFLDSNEVGTGSTEFIVMRSRAGCPTHLPYFLTRSNRFRDHAIRSMVGSSGRQRVSHHALLDFPLSRPNVADLDKFGQLSDKFFDHMKSLDAESAILAEMRDILLPELISGDTQVRDAEKVVEAVV